MILRLVMIATCCTVPMALLASDKGSNLSPFPDAGKSLQQLARESVDREIATSVQGKRPKEPTALLTLPTLPPKRLPQQARSETCSIPLLESKIEHPDRFSMKILKLPATRADNMAVPGPAPACKDWH